MKQWKLSGKIEKEYDFNTKSYVHLLSYGGVSKILLPQNDKLSLCLPHHVLIFQILLITQKSFSIEIAFTDTANIKRRIFFSTSTKDVAFNAMHCKIPLGNFPINKWSNFHINLANASNSCFKNATYKNLDYLQLSANCKIRKIFAVKSNELPRGLNLPLGVQVTEVRFDSVKEGIVFEENGDNIIEIENGQGKIIKQEKKKVFDMKQLRSRSMNKPFKEKKQKNNFNEIKENGSCEVPNVNNNSNNNENIAHLHQKYQSLSKKTKNNINFAKKIPTIEQVQSQIKYDISGRKLPSYFIAGSPKVKSKEQSHILNNPNCLINIGGNIGGNVENKPKTNNYTKNEDKQNPNTKKKGEEKQLNTFNINNMYRQQTSNLCDSIEEIYDYNENGPIIDESINGKLNNNNYCNGENIIRIDEGKFPPSDKVTKDNYLNKNEENEKGKEKKEFLEELCNEDPYVNFTLESNRPFTPPITKLVPVKMDNLNSSIKNNNLINAQDKRNNIQKGNNYYDNLIYDEDKGYYYNPKTKIYYDIKN